MNTNIKGLKGRSDSAPRWVTCVSAIVKADFFTQ